MTNTVFVYPEKTREQFGAVRYRVTWEEVRKSAIGKDDIDIDEDIVYCSSSYKTKEAAIKKAREVVDGYKTAFGAATVTKQVVDWFVEEDHIAEWSDTDDKEEIS